MMMVMIMDIYDEGNDFDLTMQNVIFLMIEERRDLPKNPNSDFVLIIFRKKDFDKVACFKCSIPYAAYD